MPDWMKTTGAFLIVMICWDCIRLFLQAYVNKWFLKNNFDEIDKALDDVEEAIEEDENDTSVS